LNTGLSVKTSDIEAVCGSVPEHPDPVQSPSPTEITGVADVILIVCVPEHAPPSEEAPHVYFKSPFVMEGPFAGEKFVLPFTVIEPVPVEMVVRNRKLRLTLPVKLANVEPEWSIVTDPGTDTNFPSAPMFKPSVCDAVTVFAFAGSAKTRSANTPPAFRRPSDLKMISSDVASQNGAASSSVACV